MKKCNKIIQIVFIILFVIIFSIFNFNEYKTFHLKKIEEKKYLNDLTKSSENFRLEDIKELTNIDFYYTPNKDLLLNIVEKINKSKNEIYLESYMLTENRIQESLIKAHKRWIDVKVLLEKSPYKSYNINNKTYDKLKKSWIKINWSNKANYSYNHSKILLIDDLSIISSWNFTYSTFTKNRDFFIYTTDKNINSKLKNNFLNDFNWIKINLFDNNLVFSPNSSRDIFEKLFLWANKKIQMYFQYVLDDKLVNDLIKLKKEKNLEIEIILAKTAKQDENTKKLKEKWINILFEEKFTMHAKAILIDDKFLFIWSENFSSNSLDENREIWILVINQKIIDKFKDLFLSDKRNLE